LELDEGLEVEAKTLAPIPACGKCQCLLLAFPRSSLDRLPRSFYHWTYEEVTDFLTAKGFEPFDDVKVWKSPG